MLQDDGKSSFPPLPREVPNAHGIKAAKWLALAFAAQLVLVFVMPLVLYLAAVGFSVGGNTGGVYLAGNPVVTTFRWLLTLAFVPALVQGIKGIRGDEKNRLAIAITSAVVIIIPLWILT
ncbi:MAG: hypothetical protein ACYTAN_09620 [Planctomycetota bacterium]